MSCFYSVVCQLCFQYRSSWVDRGGVFYREIQLRCGPSSTHWYCSRALERWIYLPLRIGTERCLARRARMAWPCYSSCTARDLCNCFYFSFNMEICGVSCCFYFASEGKVYFFIVAFFLLPRGNLFRLLTTVADNWIPYWCMVAIGSKTSAVQINPSMNSNSISYSD